MKKRLKVGVGRGIITPDVGGQLFGYRPDIISTSVNDDLTVTAIALQYSSIKAIIVSVTVCLINNNLADKIRLEISETTGFPIENILLSATHTHSGPNTCGMTGWGDIDRNYCENILLPSTISAAVAAINNLKPAVMGIGTTRSKIGINRRRLDMNGNIQLGQNPWGIFDDNLTVVSWNDLDGQPIANLIHYGTHGTAAGVNTEITRDWSGVMIDRLEQETGAITAFLNGASGDVGPRLTNGRTVGNIKYAMELGGVAALDAMYAYNQIKEYISPSLDCFSSTVSIPYQPKIPFEQAKKEVQAFNNSNTAINIDGQKLDYYNKVIAAYKTKATEQEMLKMSQTVIGIGNIAFVPFPYELFSEIVLRLREYSPFMHTFCLSYTNGSNGYFPSQDQICRGGYEIDMFLTSGVQPLVCDADNYLVSGSLALLNSLSKNEKVKVFH